MSLVLPTQFLMADPVFVGGTRLGIQLRRGSAGLVAELTGDPDSIGPIWQVAQRSGRLEITRGGELALELEATAVDGELGSYGLDETGRVVTALRSGPGADHWFEAAASDSSGNHATATTSLRSTIAALCQALPPGAICRPGL